MPCGVYLVDAARAYLDTFRPGDVLLACPMVLSLRATQLPTLGFLIEVFVRTPTCPWRLQVIRASGTADAL